MIVDSGDLRQLLPTAISPNSSRAVPEDVQLTKSMKAILNKSDRLTNKGRDKLIRLLESDIESKDVGASFKLTDTILANSNGTQAANGRNISPLTSKEKRTQFYMRKTFETSFKPRQLEAKLQRGRNLAHQMNVLKLNRIKVTNQINHQHSLNNQNKIWANSLIEKTFMNKLSNKDIYDEVIKYENDVIKMSGDDRTSKSIDRTITSSPNRSKIIQDKVMSMMKKLDEVKKDKLGLITTCKLQMGSESRDKIDVEYSIHY